MTLPVGYQSDEFFFENMCNQKKGDKKRTISHV
jgi:hypothetical protein